MSGELGAQRQPSLAPGADKTEAGISPGMQGQPQTNSLISESSSHTSLESGEEQTFGRLALQKHLNLAKKDQKYE